MHEGAHQVISLFRKLCYIKPHTYNILDFTCAYTFITEILASLEMKVILKQRDILITPVNFIHAAINGLKPSFQMHPKAMICISNDLQKTLSQSNNFIEFFAAAQLY